MTSYVFDPPPPPSAPVIGSAARFPIRRIYCVGRNFSAHAAEMGGDPAREPPFFFQKNPEDADFSGQFPYPPQSDDVHHEVELVIALGRGGRDLAPARALDLVFGYAVGLDMTRRDLQTDAKLAGRPWALAKAFEGAAPMSPIALAQEIGHPSVGRVTLHLGGALRQEGDLAQMIWKPHEIIARLSAFTLLHPGDLIFAGTPSGVGPVRRGDALEARIEGVGGLRVTVI